MNAQRFFTHPIGLILAATGATLLWGSAFPFIKLSYTALSIAKGDVFGQILFAGYRFVLAALLIFLFILLLKRSIRYEKGTFHRLIKVGSFQTFLQYFFFYIGLSHTTGITGSIIAGTTSFFQIILAHFMYKNDALTTRKTFGMTIGFLGVILVNLPNGSLHFAVGWGEILLLLAMFCGGLGNNLAKNESAYLDIFYMTAYQMLLGGLGLVAIGAIQVGIMPFHFTLVSTSMLLYLAFLSAAGFLLWNNVMKYNQVGKVSMYMFLIPVFGVLLSALLLHESLHLIVLASLLLVIAGIVLVNRQPNKKRIAQEMETNEVIL
jgi:drug/metabolite transporter (DMT)-like permease